MSNSYIEKGKSYTDWGTVIVRSNDTPLDRSSMFDSYEDALKYANGDGSDKRKLGKTSYIGQYLSVHENGIVDIYQIIGDDTKTPIERSLRKVIHEVDLSNLEIKISEKIVETKNRLISQEGSVYDCENGVLTLTTEDPSKSITIQLNSDYGTF